MFGITTRHAAGSVKQLAFIVAMLAFIFHFALLDSAVSAQEESVQKASGSIEQLASVVNAAFLETHQGFSSDEVILQTALNQEFLAACKKSMPDVTAFEFNWKLLNLRKAGKLNAKTTQQDRRKFDDVLAIAEVCARTLEDTHGKSIDRLMANPETQQQFNQMAARILPDVETYLVRKAAFRLRKTRRLRPELITRIADWGREVTEHKADDVKNKPTLIAEVPGIYIFRDDSGYLYIGEAINLRARLQQHLKESDNQSLFQYMTKREGDAEGAPVNRANEVTIEVHTFAKDSRIKELMVRRAYESELIRSRNPRFNVRP